MPTNTLMEVTISGSTLEGTGTPTSSYTDTMVLEERIGPEVNQDPPILPPTDSDVEFTNKSKRRFECRLQERWSCRTLGHVYCFADHGGVHFPLSEETIDVWVSAMHNGEATLLTPPKSIVPLNLSNTPSDLASIRSTRSRNTIQYQRPFRWQSNPSLTDYRSMQVRLRDSINASSTSSLSASSGSSGIPGIGYMSGKAVKWVGMQILNSFVPLEIRRRRWVIHRFIKRLGEVPVDKRAEWVTKKEHKAVRVVEDILELTMDQYKANFRTTAIEKGMLIDGLVVQSTFMSGSSEETFKILMLVKLFPLRLLEDSHCAWDGDARDFREVLLQDPLDLVDERHFIAEMAMQLCFELAYDAPSRHRAELYRALWLLYVSAHRSVCVRTLGLSGTLMEDLATHEFQESVSGSDHSMIREQAVAVQFFSEYANDAPAFRMHLFKPAAIPLLIENIKSLEMQINESGPGSIILLRLVFVVRDVSRLEWAIPLLTQLDLCPTLVRLLIFCQRDTGLGVRASRSAYDIVFTLRNLAVTGGHSGRQAVHDATTDELLQMLPQVEGRLRQDFGSDHTAGDTIKTYINETWT